MDGGPDLGTAQNALQKMLPTLHARFGEVCLVDLAYARQIVALLEMTIAAYTPPSNSKAIPIGATIFEFLVLRYLVGRGDNATYKQDIYTMLGTIGAEVGAFAAFNTRLTRLKLNERVTWEDNKQNAPITITDKGVESCDRLTAGGAEGLKREDFDFWAPKLSQLLDTTSANGSEA